MRREPHLSLLALQPDTGEQAVAVTGFVRHNVRVEIRFTQSARRHKIGQARVRQVIAAPRAILEVPSLTPGHADRLLILGDDETGRALEIVAVRVDGDTLLVIHAMDLRDKYRDAYEDAP